MLTLPDAVELGIQLSHLKHFENFNKLLEGFLNQTQFADTQFETKIAYLFSTLPSVELLHFSPTYTIRQHAKQPEFDAYGQPGVISVECKRPHLHFQNSAQRVNKLTCEFRKAMDGLSWPSGLRLEIDLTGPLREATSSIALRVAMRALQISKQFANAEFSDGPVHTFIVKRTSLFRIVDAHFGIDTMILGDVPTTAFNPEFTALRIMSNQLDKQIAKAVGGCVNEAMRQLPQSNNCIIFIGDVPLRIVQQVCERRLSDVAYAHIRAFGASTDKGVTLIFRETDRSFIESLRGD